MRSYEHPLYSRWCTMKTRCYNEKHPSYRYHGARGIKVCEKWHKFYGFLEDMGEGYKEGLTIERIDNDGDYTPENCRWATMKEQTDNRRNSKLIPFNGKKKTLSDWSKECGIKLSTLNSRYLDQGWSIEDSLSIPTRIYQKHIKY